MRLSALLVAGLALLAGCAGEAGRDGPTEPARLDSMAALGDSITMAANLDQSRLRDNPGHSWATGAAPGDGVESHYERLRPDVENRTVNLARSGARMSDLARQADAAVAHGARYVTILMGGNDACASSVAAMTPVETYRRHFREAAERLDRGLPEDALVYVLSLPNVTGLRDAFWDDPQARTVWRVFGVCQAILSERATEADLAAARERVVAYNRVLREESAAFGFAFDDGATFREPVRREYVSPADYFHPSLAGQRRLAEVSWAAGPLADGSG